MGSFCSRQRAWTALTPHPSTTPPSVSLGVNFSSWFLGGLRAKLHTDNNGANRRDNPKIYFTDEKVNELRSDLETLLGYRREALIKQEKNPETYKFKGTNLKQNYGESDILWMIINGQFVDKTASYAAALDTNSKASVGTRVAAFVRRFGKSTWLYFMQQCLGVPWTLGPEKTKLSMDELAKDDMEEFYKALAGTKKGTYFLESPLRPVLRINLVRCHTAEDMRSNLEEELERLGLEIEGSPSLNKLLHRGIPIVSQLYKRAFPMGGPFNDRRVDSRPLILVDEYDAPWRRKEIARAAESNAPDASTEQHENRAKMHYLELVKSVLQMCDSLRDLLSGQLYGVAMVSLLRVGGTGLSKLETTTDLGAHAEHHSLFGISEDDFTHILDNADGDSPLTWGKALSWARQVKIVNQAERETDQAEEETKKQKREFLDYLRREINRFVTAYLGRTDEPLSPLYSPRDVLSVMQNIIDNNKVVPTRNWLEDARDSFTEIISQSGRYHDAVKALLGCRIHIAEMRTYQKMSQSLEEHADMRILFYNLGLLYVKEVKGKMVVLAPVLNIRQQDIVNILTGAFKKPAELPSKEVNAYFKDPKTLVRGLCSLVPDLIRSLQATHGNLPYDALTEAAVVHAMHDLCNTYFVHSRMCVLREVYLEGKQENVVDKQIANAEENVVDKQIANAEEDGTTRDEKSRRYVDLLVVSKEEVKGQQQEEPLIASEGWRFLPSNSFPEGWAEVRKRGVLMEYKIATSKKRRDLQTKTRKGTKENQHRRFMLDALRQAWIYRDKLGYDPKDVLLMGVTTFWGEDGSLIVKCCAGPFVGHEDPKTKKKKGNPYTIAAMKKVIVNDDLQYGIWEEFTG